MRQLNQPIQPDPAIEMKSHRHQPVNEWNTCHETPGTVGDEALENVVSNTHGKCEAFTPDGGASTLGETANRQDGSDFATKFA